MYVYVRTSHDNPQHINLHSKEANDENWLFAADINGFST